MLIKQKSPSLFRRLAFSTSGELLIVFPTKVNLLYLLYTLMLWLWYLFISLPVFRSTTNMKLHSISDTVIMVKKVIMDLDSSKASCPDYVPLVVLKNCEPRNFHKYQLLSSICVWRSLVFQINGRSHWWSLYLRMLGVGLQLKATTLLLFVVSKVFGKLAKNSWLPRAMWPFFWFPVWF